MSGAITKALQLARDALANAGLVDHERNWALYREAQVAIAAALSQPAPAPQPAAPVVSDEQIDAATRHMYHNGRPTSKEYRVGIVRAILAMRPAVEPMTPFTPSQRMRLWQNTEKGKSATSLGAFERICQAVEAAHRIGQESPQPAMPVVEAFAEGWKMAADWANRDDLLPDMDSPQYAKERDERLAELRPAVEPMTDEVRRSYQCLIAMNTPHGFGDRIGPFVKWLQDSGITAKAEGGA